MLTSERQEKIMKLLETKKTVTIEELVRVFDVSVATIRRDFAYLEKEKRLKRVYGGATFISSPPLATYETRSTRNMDKKQKIGIAAAKLINDGEAVIFDIGSTALEVAKNVKNIQNLMIVTNSISVINELMDADESIKVFTLGGMVKRSENCFLGEMANRAINHYRFDKAIVSAGGVTEAGLMNYNTESANVHSLCVLNAKTRILVADSSKMGKQNFIVSSTWDSIDTVVTDSGISGDFLSFLEGMGKQVIIAD